MLFYSILIIIGIASTLVPLFLSFDKLKVKGLVYKYLGLLLAISITADIIGALFLQHMHLIANVYSIIQFFILTSIFALELGIKNKAKAIISFLFVGYITFDFISIGGLEERSTVLRLISSFWFILLSILFYIKQIDGAPSEKTRNSPSFWIVTAVITYFSGNLFLYASNLIVENQNLYQLYVPIHSFFAVAKNSFFAYGIYLENKRIRAL